MASGVLEFFGAIGVLAYRLALFIWLNAGLTGERVETAWNNPLLLDNAGGGVFMMAQFIMQPLHMLLVYLIYEGIVRFCAATFSGQVLGTLPL